MKLHQWISIVVVTVAAGGFLAGCGNLRKLEKTNPEVGLNLPARSASAAQEERRDTMRAPKIVSFRKQDGSEVFFAPVEVDSLTGEKMMSVAIDEVVISASNRRNLVERNGKINVEFIVTVPAALQDRGWKLELDPRLMKGDDTLTLDPLVYTGRRFRDMQEREYDRYGAYCDRIVDSADYFDRFGDKRAYGEYMDYIAGERVRYADNFGRMGEMTPAEAEADRRVGWITPQERERRNSLLRKYVRISDRKAARHISYFSNATDEFDHLNDYFTPRYKYQGVAVLPGGEVYTRVGGEYPDAADRNREEYLRTLAASSWNVRWDVNHAREPEVKRMAVERLAYTGFERPMVEGMLREMSDSAASVHYRAHRATAVAQLDVFNTLDTAAVKSDVQNWNRIARNEELAANRDAEFRRLVRNPYLPNARLDTVIYLVDGSIQYRYTEEVVADENTSKLHLFLNGRVGDRSGRAYRLGKTDTLTYNVASMTTFLDETPRYMQRIVLRDAEANARFFFTFPAGKSTLNDTLAVNRRQIAAVRNLTRGLMTDPVYIIDSITLRATSSPEGAWPINDRLARERAEALRRVLVSEFRVLYDSLKVSANYTLDDKGKVVMEKAKDELPDLPNLLRTKWLAEDWAALRRLIQADEGMQHKKEILAIIDRVGNPDAREWQIRLKYTKSYERMLKVLYPQMRAVDFRFNLHRRGMQQDTVYTTEIDSNYMHAVELLKKRRYDEALSILRSYEDRNTALAYMSVGYDAAAYRILRRLPESAVTPDLQYMLAILGARLGDEEQAIQYFLRSVELKESLKFRGNLDPEISRLIRKYGLFKEDFQ